MLNNKKIIAVVPAYNEESTISTVVVNLKKYADCVVVVDDCSKDATALKAESAGAVVLSHTVNGGYDRSIDDGFKKARELGADIFFTFDADGQHQEEDILRIIQPIVDDVADIVIGERPSITHFTEKIFALYMSIRWKIKDPLCGLKGYSREVYDSVGHFDTLGSIGTQLLVEGMMRGFRLKKIPIKITERSDVSRFYKKIIRANLKIAKAMFRVVILSITYKWKTHRIVTGL